MKNSGALRCCWFGGAAARYVDAFMENVNWDEVSRRAEWAQKAKRG
jgi:superoxide dismutase